MNISAGSSSEVVDSHDQLEPKEQTPLRELLGNPKITFVLGKFTAKQHY